LKSCVFFVHLPNMGAFNRNSRLHWAESIVALLSGGLAGLAGAIEVAGRTGYLTLDMSPGYGYSGIVIAMLAALHPLAVVVASVFVAGMLVGADSMSRALGVPSYISDVIVAASLISVLLASSLTQYRIRWK
jgi:simple sugar transport system permease protein